MKKQNILIFLSFCLTLEVQAQSVSTRVYNLYQSHRAMGMGNAFSAVADDYSQMMYNPAQLAFREKGEFQINLISAGFTPKSLDMVNDIKEAADTPGTDNDKALALNAALEKYYGSPVHARIRPLDVTWVRPNWGVSFILADLNVDATVQKQVGPVLDVKARKDTTLSYAYAHQVQPDLSIGVLAKLNHRSEMNNIYSSIDLAIDSKTIDFKKSEEGINFDFDLGMVWRLGKDLQYQKIVEGFKDDRPVLNQEDEKSVVEKEKEDIKVNPEKVEIKSQLEKYKYSRSITLSAVLRNVAAIGYKTKTYINKEATDHPELDHRVLDLGAAYVLMQNSHSSLVAAFEFKNIFLPDITMKKSTHMGLEYSWYNYNWFNPQVRLGLNQMYWTGGASFVLGPLDLGVVTYGEEVGTEDYKIENRVHALNLGFKF